MKFRLYREYGALNSASVFDAFEHSVKLLGHTTTTGNDGDVDVIWSVLFHGRMADNKAVWERAQQQKKPVIVLEVGGIQRGTTWKVGINGINRDAFFGDGGNDSRRSDLLGLKLKPWRTNGTKILLCGQHDRSLQWDMLPSMTRWVKETIEHIRHYTHRPIIFRPHPRCPVPQIEHMFKDVSRQTPRQTPGTYDDYDMIFDDVYCTVSWTSNPGIHSVIHGVPSYTSPSSLAYDVSIKSLANLEDPPLHDRQQWLNDYAWTEYTVEEIAQGLPLQRLIPHLIK